MRSAVRTRSSFLLPGAALAAVVVLDAVRTAADRPLVVVGLLDEPAHLLTAWLALAALMATSAGRGRGFALWVLAGAVLIDLDHVPLFLGLDVAATPGGRPVTHSLLTIAVLLAVGALARPALALAAGVALHLVRDLATGPGVPLLWPLTPGDVRVPYLAYLLLLAALTVIATTQRWNSRRSSGRWNFGQSHSAQSVPRR